MVSLDPRHLLFVYGTLLDKTGVAEVDEAMALTRSVGLGYIHGKLYAIGAYPGLRACTPTKDAPVPPKVRGRLLYVKDPAAVFPVLDRFEEFDFRAPLQSEFVRSLGMVVVPQSRQTHLCQVYYYNLPVSGRKRIVSGDFPAYRKSRQSKRGSK